MSLSEAHPTQEKVIFEYVNPCFMDDTKYIHALELLTEGVIAECVKYYNFVPLDEIKRHERHYRSLVHSPGIVGMGLGEKEVAGKLTDEFTLRFYVSKKLPKSKCRTVVPRQIETPGLGRIVTDVVEIGELRLRSGRRSMQRPAFPGCSVGIGLVAGTLGCMVKKRGRKSGYYLLTSAHVIARDGNAALKTPVFQPAPVDSIGSQLSPFAELSEVVPFEFSPRKNTNLVDAAIAKIKQSGMAEKAIIGIGNPQGVATASRHMKVQKSGRITGLTHGKIRDIHFRTRLQYERDKLGNIGWVGFKDQILVTNFSQEGDSGALVLSEKKMAVGLLFAGSEKVSVCNKIQNVFKLFDLELA